MLKISILFDGGSIEAVSVKDPQNIQVRLKKDNAADFRQWFYFRLQGAAYVPCVIDFGDVSDTAYPAGWEDYQAVASYDRKNWFRVPTSFDSGCLKIHHTPLANSVYYAYFEPYSYEQHLNLLGEVQSSGLCQIEDLGQTIDGRDLNLLTIGNQIESDIKIWLIARQHPGETMAEWLAEGFLMRLLDFQDSLSRSLLDMATVFVVPNMNPDGSYRGNLRTNAAGANLNREWANPTMEKSPEVFLVREKMLATGVDIFLDIHGDESIPYVFVSGCEGVPNYSPKMAELENLFKTSFQAACPDFQDEFGYPKCAAGKADLSWASNFVGNQFGCLSFTLEMPFKDNFNYPDDDYGWNGQRSLRMGECLLNPLLEVCRKLKNSE